MPEDATARPTIETVLERISALGATLDARITALDARITALGEELRAFREEAGIRLDRIESMTNQTRAEMLTLRADFREFRGHLKEPV